MVLKYKMMKKICLVTGGTSGIGFGILQNLLEQKDYQVISLSRSQTSINVAKQKLGQIAASVDFIQGDISIPEDCQKVQLYISQKYGRLDGLVNCAGIIKLGGIEKQTIDEWNNSINVNLTGSFILTQSLLDLLKQSSSASIVNISSMHSQKPGGSISYCVAKAGVDMLTKCLAQELSKYRIRVNSVNPGAVKTNIYLVSGDYTEEELARSMEARKETYPLGRIGDAKKDIGSMVEFLLSDKATWITGANIFVDGGISIK